VVGCAHPLTVQAQLLFFKRRSFIANSYRLGKTVIRVVVGHSSKVKRQLKCVLKYKLNSLKKRQLIKSKTVVFLDISFLNKILVCTSSLFNALLSSVTH